LVIVEVEDLGFVLGLGSEPVDLDRALRLGASDTQVAGRSVDAALGAMSNWTLRRKLRRLLLLLLASQPDPFGDMMRALGDRQVGPVKVFSASGHL
jgi:hypothetical protein